MWGASRNILFKDDVAIIYDYSNFSTGQKYILELGSEDIATESNYIALEISGEDSDNR